MSITGRTHPADRAVCAPTSIATMPLADLQAADIELAHRAIQLGKPGQVSRPHQAVKNAIAAANNPHQGAHMTTSTVNLATIAAPLLRTGMTTSSGVARNVRTELMHGLPHICWSDDTPEGRLAPFDAVVQVTPDSVIRPRLVATAQVHGGTRVITLTITRHKGRSVATLHAYDSNHPSADKVMHVATSPVRDDLISEALAVAAELLRPSTEDEACACYADWDPYCGVPGCWGVYDAIVPATAASNS